MTQLSRATGIPVPYLSQFERGRMMPTSEEFIAVMAVFEERILEAASMPTREDQSRVAADPSPAGPT